MKLLENKTAIITGASRGIGKGIALEFASQGIGIKAKAYKSNAAHFNDCQYLIKDVLKDFSSVDILINNAGITKDNLLLRMDEEAFDKVIEVNLKSVFNMTKSILSTFLKQRKGVLIHMSSVVGVKGNAGQTNYAASKSGIIGFSKSIALELASRNIRSNVVAPGYIATEMTDKLPEDSVKQWIENIPLKRSGTPVDIANVCVFLASEMSSYITGQVLNVDGGMVT